MHFGIPIKSAFNGGTFQTNTNSTIRNFINRIDEASFASEQFFTIMSRECSYRAQRRSLIAPYFTQFTNVP